MDMVPKGFSAAYKYPHSTLLSLPSAHQPPQPLLKHHIHHYPPRQYRDPPLPPFSLQLALSWVASLQAYSRWMSVALPQVKISVPLMYDLLAFCIFHLRNIPVFCLLCNFKFCYMYTLPPTAFVSLKFSHFYTAQVLVLLLQLISGDVDSFEQEPLLVFVSLDQRRG